MINYHKIILDLEKLIAGDVVYDTKTLEKYSKDASLFKIRPQVVVFPKDKFDIQAIVKYVRALKALPEGEGLGGAELSITARAAGTDMSGGAVNDSIILDITKYLNKIGELEKVPPLYVKRGLGGDFSSNEFVQVEPGVYFRDLEKFLDKYNLMYPSYPASKDLCCVGGIVSNNSSGEKTLLYGSTKDWIEEVEVVLEDGTITTFKEISFDELKTLSSGEGKVRVLYKNIFNLISENKDLIEKEKPQTSKNSSGYFLWECINWEKETINLAKLICGSQGTLGIITKIKLRVTEKPRFSQMLTVMLPDLVNMSQVVESVLKFKPQAVETFDDKTFKIVFKFLPTVIWRLKGSIFQLGASFLPEVWMALTGGFPKLILLVEFVGQTQEEADKKAKQALEYLQQFKYKARVTKSELEMQKYWLFRHESFNLLRKKLSGYKVAPFIEDLVVPDKSMPEFIGELQKILDSYKFIYTIQGHAGNGNFHIFPLMKLVDMEEVSVIKEINQKVFSLVQKYHGSISAEHNDGLVRTPYLHFMFSDTMLDLFQKTKNIFDPLNIFNPNKKVGGNIEKNYAKIDIYDAK